MDNYLEKSKSSSYLPIKLGDKYSVVGADYVEYDFPQAHETDSAFVYKSPFRDYIYDIKYNRLLPADAKYEEPTQKPTENPEDKLKQIFDLKYNITPSPSPSLKEGFANEGEKNQIPENVDNKLLEKSLL